jgi:hypothetical protein
MLLESESFGRLLEMKYMITAGLLSLGLMVTSAQAQEESRQDITVSAFGIFQQGTSGNGINQSGEETPGVLATYRYFFTDHQGVEIDYGFARFNQQFSAPGATTPFSLGVPADMNEATASYVYRHPIGHRLTPFVTAGTGALLFVPSAFAVGGANGSTFAGPCARLPHLWNQETIMAGRGPQSFKKRQKEQQRKERQMEKAQRRLDRKEHPIGSQEQEELKVLDRPYVLPEFRDAEDVPTQ